MILLASQPEITRNLPTKLWLMQPYLGSFLIDQSTFNHRVFTEMLHLSYYIMHTLSSGLWHRGHNPDDGDLLWHRGHTLKSTTSVLTTVIKVIGDKLEGSITKSSNANISSINPLCFNCQSSLRILISIFSW